MTITTTKLTRAAGLAAVAAGLLFIAVQIDHPHLDAVFVTTTDYTIRQTAKVVMAVLSLAGITGMYLRQVSQTGVLGLLGYLVFGAGYLLMLGVELIGVAVLPSLANSQPGYVDDVLTTAIGGTATGDIGLLKTIFLLSGVTFIGGGLLFGIALFRADILSRWAAVLLAVGTVASLLIPVLPQINFRLFAVPVAIAMIGLGYSLWRDQRPVAVRPVPNTPQLDPAGAA